MALRAPMNAIAEPRTGVISAEWLDWLQGLADGVSRLTTTVAAAVPPPAAAEGSSDAGSGGGSITTIVNQGGAPDPHHTTHEAGGSDPIKLDALATPDDVLTLNATTARHGLLPKLSGNASEMLIGTGAWAAGASGPAGPAGPAGPPGATGPAGPPGSSTSLTQTFLTSATEATLANARRLVAGANIAFDATTAGQLRVDAVPPSVPTLVDYLVVGGGGGGGAGSGNARGAGGGGAGGLVTGSDTITPPGSYAVVVGTGGAGATSSSVSGSPGGGSSFNGHTTVGGGGGGSGDGGLPSVGGSGGGAGDFGGTSCSGGAATSGQGFPGGVNSASAGSGGSGAGGGGAGGAGAPGVIVSATRSAGGVGVVNSLSGTAVTYAVGGQGGQYLAGAAGVAGTANRGTGGGGGDGQSGVANGAAGGAGVVIISYVTGVLSATGGTITVAAGRTIHTFTTSGTWSVAGGNGVTTAEQTISATGTQHNVSLANGNVTVRCTNTAPLEITGFSTNGNPPSAGDRVTMINAGTSTVRVGHQETGSTAVNRCVFPSIRGQILGVAGGLTLVYDGTTSRWRVASLHPGTAIPIPYNATDFTGYAPSGEIWTVDPADVTLAAYVQCGAELHLYLTISNSTISGASQSFVQFKFPNGFTCASAGVQAVMFGRCFDGTVWNILLAAINTAVSVNGILLLTYNGASLALVVNTFTVQGSAVLLVD